MGVLSEQGQAAVEFVRRFGGDVDAAIAVLHEVRPLVAAERMRELQQVLRTATSTPTEAPAGAVSVAPAAGDDCPCGSGKKLVDCHGAESEAA